MIASARAQPVALKRSHQAMRKWPLLGYSSPSIFTSASADGTAKHIEGGLEADAAAACAEQPATDTEGVILDVHAKAGKNAPTIILAGESAPEEAISDARGSFEISMSRKAKPM